MSIFVTSDLHLNHKNILTYCRPQFKTIEEHNKYIIDRYNSIVGKDDVVYILGDVGFGPKEEVSQLVRQLNGRKILILGNHDRRKKEDYRGMGFIEVYDHPIYYSNNIVLSHIPIKEAYENPWIINVHGHIHRGNMTLPNYFNANVEMNDFLPVNIEVYKKKSEEICVRYRWQPFGTEWYHDFEWHENEEVTKKG